MREYFRIERVSDVLVTLYFLGLSSFGVWHGNWLGGSGWFVAATCWFLNSLNEWNANDWRHVAEEWRLQSNTWRQLVYDLRGMKVPGNDSFAPKGRVQ